MIHSTNHTIQTRALLINKNKMTNDGFNMSERREGNKIVMLRASERGVCSTIWQFLGKISESNLYLEFVENETDSTLRKQQ